MTVPTPAFHAVLFPHRSLGRRGFLVLLAVVGGVMGVAAVRSAVLGAWPVTIFAILDVFLVWGAFKLSYRSGRQFEEVSISDDEVVIRKVTPAGRVTEHRFNALWARLNVTRHEEDGVTRLDLGSHGKWVVIGAFLDPDARASFADAFGEALARARAPAAS